MKKNKSTSILSKINILFFLLILIMSNGYAQIDTENRSKLIKPEANITDDIIWQVKAFRPDAQI